MVPVDTHDMTIQELRALAPAIDLDHVSASFLSSLFNKDLARWSPLGSIAVARLMPNHSFAPISEIDKICRVCGQYRNLRPRSIEKLEARRKQGGIFHGDSPEYNLFDLKSSLLEQPLAPDKSNQDLFNVILNSVLDLPNRANIFDAHKVLRRALSASTYECLLLLNIFGILGALETAEHMGFSSAYINYRDRFADRHFPEKSGDFAYPVAWWTRSDGINLRALQTFKLSKWLDAETMARLESQ